MNYTDFYAKYVEMVDGMLKDCILSMALFMVYVSDWVLFIYLIN